MKYELVSKVDCHDSRELTYEEALDYVLGIYKDCDITRDMLTIGNRINLRFNYLVVYDDKGMTLMAGYTNFTPEGVAYDQNGNRKED